MCFSAEASFTIGSVLTTIGAVGSYKIKKWPLRLLALLPLLLAAQQFTEGFVWLYMNGTIQNPTIGNNAILTYLFFAWIAWPLYIPAVFYFIEKDQWRKLVNLFCFALGLLVLYVDGRHLLTQTVVAKVVENSIYYAESPFYAHAIYGTAVIAPFLVSGLKKMWALGILVLTSFIVAQIIYTVTFTSVWCFFAAACSMVLIKILIPQDVKRTLHDGLY